MNPYNCTKIGHAFVGHDENRDSIVSGVKGGHSFAVFAGEKSGKSSFLHQVYDDLLHKTPGEYFVVPKLISIELLEGITAEAFFKEIYELIIGDICGEQKINLSSFNPYQEFLVKLDNIHCQITKKYGLNWRFVLLIDDFDLAIDLVDDDQLFQYLRNLFGLSRYKSHFQLIVTGSRPLSKIISSGGSTLNFFRSLYLGSISSDAVNELVALGFTGVIDENVVKRLSDVTGNHPFLIQAILEKIWDRKEDLTVEAVMRSKEIFYKEHKIFHAWVNRFNEVEKNIYYIIATSPNLTINIKDIKRKITTKYTDGIFEPLITLSYHGIIDDSDHDYLRISSILFKDWFLENESVKLLESKTFSGEQSNSISVVDCNTNISISQLRDIIQIFVEMKKELDASQMPDSVRRDANNALKGGLSEIANPSLGGHVDTQKVQSSVEDMTKILKKSVDLMSSVTTVIEKAEKLGPYLGKAAGWITTFFYGS